MTLERITFALPVLGCRTNQAESDALRSHLLAGGAREAAEGESPELVIVNTCAVTTSAEAQSRQAVRRAVRAARPGAVIVTGCAAQRAPEDFARLPGVALVVGNASKSRLPDWIAGALGARGDTAAGWGARIAACAGARPAAADGAACDWSPDPTPTTFLRRGDLIPRWRTRALLKIQDGCNQTCAYCIVTRLRGRPVARDPEDVLDEARRLVSGGYREIVLTGVNLGLYCPPGEGADAPGGAGLAALLARLEALPGIARIRLSSLEPMTIGEPLIEALARTRRVSPHLHLSLQSGDDGVLARMGRPYDTAAFQALVERLVADRPRLAVGVDLIAGFPGESEESFGRTLDFVERLPVAALHAFAFAERPGTPAVGFRDPVPVGERKARVRRLCALDARLRQRYQQRLAGQRCRVLVERCRAGVFEGFSGEYVRMRGTAPGVQAGELIEVIAGDSLGPRVQACRPAGEA